MTIIKENGGDIKNNYTNLVNYPKKAKSKILIVDDNEILLRTLNKMLSELISLDNEEFEIITANDGLDILNYIIEDQFKGNLIKCIITDENMEFINGSDAVGFLSKLQSRNKIKNISVIFLSSYDDDYNLGYLKATRDCAFMTKPLSARELERQLIEMEIFSNLSQD